MLRTLEFAIAIVVVVVATLAVFGVGLWVVLAIPGSIALGTMARPRRSEAEEARASRDAMRNLALVIAIIVIVFVVGSVWA